MYLFTAGFDLEVVGGYKAKKKILIIFLIHRW